MDGSDRYRAKDRSDRCRASGRIRQMPSFFTGQTDDVLVARSDMCRANGWLIYIMYFTKTARGIGSVVKHSTADLGIASSIPLTPTKITKNGDMYWFFP